MFQYLRNMLQALRLTGQRLRNTFRKRPTAQSVADATYFQAAPATLQYPHEQLPVPERGRYRLHNEIDDCIVCDKCAQVCPVDCITIEAIPAPGPIGKTSNGMTKRLYAAQFDIDMAQCCFCGLCTTVCPTQCLTMTPDYDYSVFDWADHRVPFATMTPEEIAAAKQQAKKNA